MIRSNGRRGTVVLARSATDRKIEQELHDIVIKARSDGIDAATLLGIVAAAHAE